MLYHPNVSIESGDTLVAEADNWGHLADTWDEIPIEGEVAIEFGGRCDRPLGNDTYQATVNGTEMPVHIDIVTEIFSIGDSVTFER